MAGTLKIRVAFKYEKGNITEEREWEYTDSFNDSDDSDVEHLTWSVPTGGGSVLSQTGPGGVTAAKNHDATNFQQIFGNTAEDPLIQLLPGDVCIFRTDEDAPSDVVKSDTAAALFEVLVFPARAT